MAPKAPTLLFPTEDRGFVIYSEFVPLMGTPEKAGYVANKPTCGALRQNRFSSHFLFCPPENTRVTPHVLYFLPIAWDTVLR